MMIFNIRIPKRCLNPDNAGETIDVSGIDIMKYTITAKRQGGVNGEEKLGLLNK